MYSANVSCPKLVSIENILRLIQKLVVRGGVGCFDERVENRNAVSVSLRDRQIHLHKTTSRCWDEGGIALIRWEGWDVMTKVVDETTWFSWWLELFELSNKAERTHLLYSLIYLLCSLSAIKHLALPGPFRCIVRLLHHSYIPPLLSRSWQADRSAALRTF